SVAVSGGTTGLTTSGGPITTSGTIALGGTLAVANGGTGATSAAGALASLGAAPTADPTFTGTVTADAIKSSSAYANLTLEPGLLANVQVRGPLLADVGLQVGSFSSPAHVQVYGNVGAIQGSFSESLESRSLLVGSNLGGGTILYGGTVDPVLQLRYAYALGDPTGPFVGFYTTSSSPDASIGPASGAGGVLFSGLDQIEPPGSSPTLTVKGNVVPDASNSRTLGSPAAAYAQAYALTPVRPFNPTPEASSYVVTASDLNALITVDTSNQFGEIVLNDLSIPIGFKLTVAKIAGSNWVYFQPSVEIVNKPGFFSIGIGAKGGTVTFVKIGDLTWLAYGDVEDGGA
ncbi:MAG TPA: hypothetical protein VFM53_02425, partial [Anaeromyxobacteraceae bacterium]|nr:hypothetical protein [Anaeromyxobacteraceae bacterium]